MCTPLAISGDCCSRATSRLQVLWSKPVVGQGRRSLEQHPYPTPLVLTATDASCLLLAFNHPVLSYKTLICSFLMVSVSFIDFGIVLYYNHYFLFLQRVITTWYAAVLWWTYYFVTSLRSTQNHQYYSHKWVCITIKHLKFTILHIIISGKRKYGILYIIHWKRKGITFFWHKTPIVWFQ